MDSPAILRLLGWVAIVPGFLAFGVVAVSSRLEGPLVDWCVRNWWWVMLPGICLYFLFHMLADGIEWYRSQ